ncbi:hypothetical protein ACJIZ3_018328 [Penstemon smallii]|uniref:UBX domain-containing protein n=1 Tax=Penstemon smallii TaxID=265156 RepID=A0ABD3SYX0_9LAMI
MSVDSSTAFKRRRFIAVSLMDSELAKAKLAAAKEKYGRDIQVFQTTLTSASTSNVSDAEEADDFYEFTPEDYFRLLGTKKEDKYLKTKKIRDAEEAARRSRLTKAGIRVRFPDNYTLQVSFHPSETIQSLIDFLKRVIVHTDLPFYLYTTPPKKQIKDMSQDFYSAGFVPGAIVYFAYDVPKGDNDALLSGPFLHEDVKSLEGLEFMAQQAEPTPEPAVTIPAVVPERKPSDKKTVKPKWLKM